MADEADGRLEELVKDMPKELAEFIREIYRDPIIRHVSDEEYEDFYLTAKYGED